MIFIFKIKLEKNVPIKFIYLKLMCFELWKNIINYIKKRGSKIIASLSIEEKNIVIIQNNIGTNFILI